MLRGFSVGTPVHGSNQFFEFVLSRPANREAIGGELRQEGFSRVDDADLLTVADSFGGTMVNQIAYRLIVLLSNLLL